MDRKRFFALMSYEGVVYIGDYEEALNDHEEFDLSDSDPDHIITILRDYVIDNEMVSHIDAPFYQVYRELTEEEYRKLVL